MQAISEAAGIGNLIVAVLCVPVAFAIAAKAETLFLKISVLLLLCAEAWERVLIGYARTTDPSGESVDMLLSYVYPARYVIALGLIALFFSTMRLQREEAKEEEDGG